MTYFTPVYPSFIKKSRAAAGKECPNAQLKEIKERKGDRCSRMIRTVKFFLPAKAVISLHKNSKDSLEILQLSGETPAAPRQRWDIMAQISVDALYGKGVIFVVDIADMLSWKDHIQIPAVSICTIAFRLRSRIDHSLDRPGHLVPTHDMSQNLSRISAHHRHNIDVFPGFCSGFIL